MNWKEEEKSKKHTQIFGQPLKERISYISRIKKKSIESLNIEFINSNSESRKI